MKTFTCKYCNKELNLTKDDNTHIIYKSLRIFHYECYHSNVLISYIVVDDRLHYTKFYNANIKYALEIDHHHNNLVLYLSPHIFIQRFKFIFDDITPDNFENKIEKLKLLMPFQ